MSPGSVRATRRSPNLRLPDPETRGRDTSHGDSSLYPDSAPETAPASQGWVEHHFLSHVSPVRESLSRSRHRKLRTPSWDLLAAGCTLAQERTVSDRALDCVSGGRTGCSWTLVPAKPLRMQRDGPLNPKPGSPTREPEPPDSASPGGEGIAHLRSHGCFLGLRQNAGMTRPPCHSIAFPQKAIRVRCRGLSP